MHKFVKPFLHTFNTYNDVLYSRAFFTMLLDEVTRNLYPSKYSMVVKVMLRMFCGETKGVRLNFQGMRHSYSKPYRWTSLKNKKPRYGIHSHKGT